MPEDDPKAFAAFNYHLYAKMLIFTDLDCDEVPELYGEDLRVSIETWIFADKYDLNHLQDSAMHAICTLLYCASSSSNILSWRSLASCFSKTMPDCPLRKLAGDYVVTKMEQGGHNLDDLLAGLAHLEGAMVALYEAKSRYHTDDIGTFFSLGQVWAHKLTHARQSTTF